MTSRSPTQATSTTGSSCLYFGGIGHVRTRPFAHRFAYRAFSLLIDLDELPALDRRLRFLSHNRWNLFSLDDRDFGPRDGRPLKAWIDGQLKAAGLDPTGGRVRLLCIPRIFGYVFNPLAIWFCYNANERLIAVLYDVSNTFGQAHGYLLVVDPRRRPGQSIAQRCAKRFYVSPFMDMDATYRFRLHEPGESLSIRIVQEDMGGTILVATQAGRRVLLTDAALLRALVSYPLMSVKVIGGIYWEAIRLWRKGARIRPRPAPPAAPVTVVGPPEDHSGAVRQTAVR